MSVILFLIAGGQQIPRTVPTKEIKVDWDITSWSCPPPLLISVHLPSQKFLRILVICCTSSKSMIILWIRTIVRQKKINVIKVLLNIFHETLITKFVFLLLIDSYFSADTYKSLPPPYNVSLKRLKIVYYYSITYHHLVCLPLKHHHLNSRRQSHTSAHAETKWTKTINQFCSSTTLTPCGAIRLPTSSKKTPPTCKWTPRQRPAACRLQEIQLHSKLLQLAHASHPPSPEWEH